jgi:hypothetical protein
MLRAKGVAHGKRHAEVQLRQIVFRAQECNQLARRGHRRRHDIEYLIAIKITVLNYQYDAPKLSIARGCVIIRFVAE